MAFLLLLLFFLSHLTTVSGWVGVHDLMAGGGKRFQGVGRSGQGVRTNFDERESSHETAIG